VLKQEPDDLEIKKGEVNCFKKELQQPEIVKRDTLSRSKALPLADSRGISRQIQGTTVFRDRMGTLSSFAGFTADLTDQSSVEFYH
jgi:hypothetical protein